MEFSDFDRVIEVATSHLPARCLHLVAELGVADQLGDAPMSAEALALATGAEPNALERVLRLLAIAGIFRQEGLLWAHTERSRIVRSDHPQSLRPYIQWLGGRAMWHGIGELQHSACTGEPVIEKFRQGSVWDYFREHPDAGRRFDLAMESRSRSEIAALLSVFDFSRYELIADVGGGRGHLLSVILDATPRARGILFDQPDVVSALAPRPRMSLQGGDFFTGPLPTADAYVVGNVLHNWAEGPAGNILRSVRRAAPAHAELLVLEAIMPDGPEPHPTKVLDIEMLAFTGGRERTRTQHEALLAAAGFRLDRVVTARCPTSIIVGVPV